MKRVSGIVLCAALMISVAALGCGGGNQEDTQIKQLVTGTPTPTAQPEVDNPENTQTTDGVSMTNDYLNQKEAGQVPTINDNASVSSASDESGTAADGEGSQSTDEGSTDTQDESTGDTSEESSGGEETSE